MYPAGDGQILREYLANTRRVFSSPKEASVDALHLSRRQIVARNHDLHFLRQCRVANQLAAREERCGCRFRVQLDRALYVLRIARVVRDADEGGADARRERGERWRRRIGAAQRGDDGAAAGVAEDDDQLRVALRDGVLD